VVQALLAAAAGTAVQTQYGATALICASDNGHLALVQVLLAAGSDTAVQNQHGDTALVCASRRGHTAVAAALSAAIAPPDNVGGAAGEPPDYGTYSLAQLKDACRAKGLPVGGTKAVLRARLEAAAPPLQ
jgi:ankyrin repeat protein